MIKKLLVLAAASLSASALFAQSTLTITTPNGLPVATVGQAYSAQIAAAGGTPPYAWNFQSGGNPSPRFSLSSSGLLTGTPTSADLGSLTFAIQVIDANSVIVSKQFTFAVQTTQPLALTTTAFTPGVTAVPYSFQLTGTGGTPPYKWDVLPAIVTFPVPGQVAPGLMLDSTTGLVTGTPTSAGSTSFTITLTDKANGSVSKPYTITVTAGGPLGIVTTSLVSGIVGAAYSQTLEAKGGIPPYKWAVVTGTLPRGLTLDATAGTISGAPLDVGTSSFTISLTDNAGTPNTTRQAFSIAVTAPPALTISTTSLPNGTQSSPYSQKVVVSGGVPPYRWSITTGALPAGLNLGATTGIIDGTPTTDGSATFTVQVLDSAAGTPAKATIFLGLTIAKLTQVSIATKTLDRGTVNTPYSSVLQASGGASPYSWSVLTGSLPPGLYLNGAGTLSGVPTASGDFGFTAQLVDSSGASAIGTVSVSISTAPLTLAPLTLPSAIAGSPYPSQVISATGGIQPYTFSIQGSLPNGISLTNGTLSGTPVSTGTSTFTVKVTDAVQATATASQQLVVRSALPADLVLSAGALSFVLASGATDVPEPRNLLISSSSITTPLSYQITVSPAVSWLNVSGASTGGTPGAVTVSLTSQALALAPAAAPYTTTITVACFGESPCSGNSQRIVVSLAVTAPPPQLTLTTSVVALASTAAGISPKGLFGIQNSGGGSIALNSVTPADSWLSVDGIPSTVAPGVPVYLNVTANQTGLTPGRLYRSTIRVATSAGTANLPVTLLVSAGMTLTLNPVGQQFQMSAGGAVGNPNGTFQVLVGGSSTVSWTAAVVGVTPWLIVKTPAGSSTSSAPGSLSYSIDPVSASFAAGTYYGRIRVVSAQVTNTPQEFVVVLNVAPAGTAPDPELQPAGLLFISSETGTTPSQSVTLYASSVNAVPYQASATTLSGSSWLSVSPTVGSASASSPGRPVVTVNKSGLTPGVYRGVVTYQFSSASQRSVNVTYIVPTFVGGLPFFQSGAAAGELKPRATCSPTKVVATATGLPSNFAQPASWPTLLSVVLADDCGAAIGNGAVNATFSSGEPPVVLSPDTTSSGRYVATWVPKNAASQVTVTAFASAPGLASARTQITGKVTPNVAPALTPGGMLNVFNPALGGGIAPGMAVQIYGTNLAPAGTSALASSVPFSTTLSGTSVIIGGTPAPLYYVSPGQINALAPFELKPGNTYQVLVSVSGAITTPDQFIASDAAPGIAAFANGNIIATHVDGSLITDASPAKPSEIIVLYLAGLGSATNQPATGSAAPLPPTEPVNPATVTIAGKTPETKFIGLTPFSVGLYQINLVVPSDTPDGSQTLTVSQAGTASNLTILPVKK